MTDEPSTTKDKQITLAVTEERMAEFYAFYGRFPAGFPTRRGCGHRHGCGPRHADETARGPDETQTA